MARHTGAVCKLCRAEGRKLFLKGTRCYSDKCQIERRNYPPGEHGRRRIRESEYRLQLREKQKAKRFYGVLEKQFRSYYERAARQKGITGENLLAILESRADNVLHRAGLALSRAQARQLIGHGHVLIDGKKVSIPSYRLKAGQIVEVKEKSHGMPVFEAAKKGEILSIVPEWLEVDKSALIAKVLQLPKRDQIELDIEENAIVEMYSK